MSFRTGNVVLLAGLLAMSACGKVEAPAEEQLRPVRYITVSDASAFRDRSFSGTSKSSRESRLSFKVSGTVTSIPVQIGERLNAGDRPRPSSDRGWLNSHPGNVGLRPIQSGHHNHCP